MIIFKPRCLSSSLFSLLRIKETSLRYLEWKMILNILLSEVWHNSLPEVNMNIKRGKSRILNNS